MSNSTAISVSHEDEGKRADIVLAARLSGLSRSAVQALFHDGLITLEGNVIKPSYRVREGNVIDVRIVPRPSLSARPQAIPLDVVYQDQDLAVVDKPAGLVVHPAAGHESGTLANALMNLFPHASEVGSELRPGIVHRLDKDTSGLMVVALSDFALRDLQAQIATRTLSRKYLALASGHVVPETGTIEAPIGRHRTDRKRMAVHGVASKAARTSYHVLEYFDGLTLLEASLQTGRTHQIRVHLAAVGHPIVGDLPYGGHARAGPHRQFLHAYNLAMTSPSTGERLEFTSPLPADLQQVLDDLCGERRSET